MLLPVAPVDSLVELDAPDVVLVEELVHKVAGRRLQGSASHIFFGGGGGHQDISIKPNLPVFLAKV